MACHEGAVLLRTDAVALATGSGIELLELLLMVADARQPASGCTPRLIC
jgi:hypothetical protein